MFRCLRRLIRKNTTTDGLDVSSETRRERRRNRRRSLPQEESRWQRGWRERRERREQRRLEQLDRRLREREWMMELLMLNNNDNEDWVEFMMDPSVAIANIDNSWHSTRTTASSDDEDDDDSVDSVDSERKGTTPKQNDVRVRMIETGQDLSR